MSTRQSIAVAAVSLLIAACSDPVAPATSCNTTLQPVALGSLEGTTVRAADFGRCVQLAVEGGADYLVVPQFAAEGQEGNPAKISFLLGTADSGNPEALASVARSAAVWGQFAGATRTVPAAERFHRMLRQQESELAATVRTQRRDPSALRAQISSGPPAASRSFQVLSNLNGKEFDTITATLKYVGTNIYVYVDDATPESFVDTDWQNFGKLFNDDLYPIDIGAFGSVSDVDGNDGHVIALFTPVVNALIDPQVDGCGSYVAGFFTGYDLSTNPVLTPHSNSGEVFYSSVPDPTGSRGCPLSASQVNLLTPATFIHELQHMISYNQHVLVRGGEEENVWLNEGLSLIAEELGAKYYEAKYPPPSGRTNPDQIFPDSARGFIEFNLGYAYDWLTATRDSSVTTFADFGSLPERGAAWLFLRWLGDQKGEGIYRQLDQTSLRGIANVSATAGESFPALFGDFGVALWTDSLPGIPRTSIPPRYRFTSRNFREIFARLSALRPGSFPSAYPVSPILLDVGNSESGSMPVGTMDFFVLRTAGATLPTMLRFSRPDRAQLPGSAQAQVSIFRLPSAP
jgi:hypothetical protein